MNIDQFLRDRGYESYTPPFSDHERAAWSLRQECETGRWGIHVKEWDLRHLAPHIIKTVSYEVEACFESGVAEDPNSTRGVWWTGKFYGLSTEQLHRLLPTMEEHHAAIFKALGGIGQ